MYFFFSLKCSFLHLFLLKYRFRCGQFSTSNIISLNGFECKPRKQGNKETKQQKSTIFRAAANIYPISVSILVVQQTCRNSAANLRTERSSSLPRTQLVIRRLFCESISTPNSKPTKNKFSPCKQASVKIYGCKNRHLFDSFAYLTILHIIGTLSTNVSNFFQFTIPYSIDIEQINYKCVCTYVLMTKNLWFLLPYRNCNEKINTKIQT